MVVRTLARSIRQYRKESILSPVFMVVEVVMEVLIPFFMASLIDKGISVGDMAYIARMGAVLIAFALVSLTAGILSGLFAAKATTGLAANLRHDIFRNIQKFSFSNIDRFSTSSLVTRLTTDVTNVQMAYQAIIRLAVRSVVMIAFALTMAFRTNAQVARVFLFVIPVLGIGLFSIPLHVHPLFRMALRTYDKLNGVVQENLRGVRVVKSFVRGTAPCEADMKSAHLVGYADCVSVFRGSVGHCRIKLFFRTHDSHAFTVVEDRATLRSDPSATAGLAK